MPLITPDLSQMEDLGNIPAGTYPARIVAVEAKTSDKGNPMIIPSFKVNVAGKERTRKAYVVVAGPGAYNFDQLLRSVGLDAVADSYKTPGPKAPFETEDLVGKTLNVVVEEETYNGQLRDKVKSFMKA